MALSVGLAYGQAGILSMAPAAFGSIGAYSTAILATRYGLSPFVGLVAAVVLPMLFAYPLARSITRLSPLPLSIATLMVSLVLELAIREGGEFTGGYIGISGIPPIPFVKGLVGMHVLAWVLVIFTVVLYTNVLDSTIGRAVRTSRHDPLRATADGVNVPRLLASFFALSAGIAGLAGWLYAHYMSYMGPDSLTMHVSIKIVLMAVVGGAATLLGPIAGAAVLTLLTLYLPASEAQGMFFGATLIIVLLISPNGIFGYSLNNLGLKGKLFGRASQSVKVKGQ